jgi:competence protein ComEC
MSETERRETDTDAGVAGSSRRIGPWPIRNGGRRAVARAWLDAIVTKFGATFEREMDRGRGFLWLPVAFGTGILIYYALPTEPSVVALALAAGLLIVLAWRRRHTATGFRVLVVAAAIASGLFTAKVRTDWVAAPVLPREMTATVTGWISAAEESASGGKRVRIRVASIEGMAPADLPKIARITIRSGAANLVVGERGHGARQPRSAAGADHAGRLRLRLRALLRRHRRDRLRLRHR